MAKYDMSAINIYAVPQVVQLTVEGINARANMITASTYGRSTFKLFRRVHNDIDFLIRDIDRQPVVISGELVIHIWDDTGKSISERALTVMNTQRGHYRLALSADDLSSIRAGIYVWSITQRNADVDRLLYTNHDYGQRGIVEITEGLLTAIPAPLTITPEDMTPLDGGLYSSALLGADRVSNSTGNHTVVAHLANYSGGLIVEGTLDPMVPADATGWVEIWSEVFISKNAIVPINFIGHYTYVRFRMTTPNGFTKLVYRN